MHELMTRCCCWLAEPAAASNTATHTRGCLLRTYLYVWLTLPLLCPAPALPCPASALPCYALCEMQGIQTMPRALVRMHT